MYLYTLISVAFAEKKLTVVVVRTSAVGTCTSDFSIFATSPRRRSSSCGPQSRLSWAFDCPRITACPIQPVRCAYNCLFTQFLSFSSPPVMSGTDRTTQPSRIAQFADYQFGLQPKRAAIAFMPVTLVPCAHDSRPVEAVAERTRLGLWQSHLRVRDFETKLLMRTDAVAMFHVHYVSALEDVHDGSAAGVARAEAVVLDSAHTVPLEMGAVLHYKLPAEWSGSVFGAVLPVNSKSSNFSTSCADCVVAALNALTTFYAAASSKTVVYPEEPNRFDGQIIDDARKRECLRLADFMAHPPHGQQSLFVRAEDMVDLKSLAATVKKRNPRSLYSSVYHRESAAPAPPG
jgi:hypothetical protein